MRPWLMLLALFVVGCTLTPPLTMKLSSPAFEDGGMIPTEYTCDGADESPELHIADVPDEAVSLALIMDDPDAPRGTFVHWVVWDIDPATTLIPHGVAHVGEEGMTDFKREGYGGPCPPSGTHRYYFKLYALDTRLELGEGATKAELEAAMQGHILAEAVLMGRYTKGR